MVSAIFIAAGNLFLGCLIFRDNYLIIGSKSGNLYPGAIKFISSEFCCMTRGINRLLMKCFLKIKGFSLL